MPIVVDHRERRWQVAEVAADLIAKVGIEGVTVREVAAAAGYSTTVVSHYFEDKGELMRMAYRVAVARARRRVDAAAAKSGPRRLQGCVEAMLPMDAERLRDWRVWFALWGMAVAQPALEREQRQRMKATVELVTGLLADGASGVRARRAAEARAEEILIAVNGIAAQAVFDPAAWPPARQSAAIRALLGRLGEEHGAAERRPRRGKAA